MIAVVGGRWLPAACSATASCARCAASAKDDGLEALDVENLRRHYARTCALWTENFESKAEQIKLLTDPRKFRISLY